MNKDNKDNRNQIKTKQRKNNYNDSKILINNDDSKQINNNDSKILINNDDSNILINKGHGAGGSLTNYYGKQFENITNNLIRLLNDGYCKHNFSKKPHDYYLFKIYEDKTITFVVQNGFKKYMFNKYNIELFRYPDEAYIIEFNTGEKIVKILEKKEQRVEGSIETKLWSSPSLKREYELILGDKFKIQYGLCVNDFLKQKITSIKKKYVTLNKILNEHNITVLFGDDVDYFEKLNKWI